MSLVRELGSVPLKWQYERSNMDKFLMLPIDVGNDLEKILNGSINLWRELFLGSYGKESLSTSFSIKSRVFSVGTLKSSSGNTPYNLQEWRLRILNLEKFAKNSRIGASKSLLSNRRTDNDWSFTSDWSKEPEIEQSDKRNTRKLGSEDDKACERSIMWECQILA